MVDLTSGNRYWISNGKVFEMMVGDEHKNIEFIKYQIFYPMCLVLTCFIVSTLNAKRNVI